MNKSGQLPPANQHYNIHTYSFSIVMIWQITLVTYLYRYTATQNYLLTHLIWINTGTLCREKSNLRFIIANLSLSEHLMISVGSEGQTSEPTIQIDQ